MRVAVVTPYYKENVATLRRCINSVAAQTLHATHIMVSDGIPNDYIDSYNAVEHIKLPKNHNDVGATPRALGAISAFSRGFDAVSFLDADNWYMNNHIETMVNIMVATKVDTVTATRVIYSQDNTPLYVDTIESTGNDTVDTNCMFMSNKTLHLMPLWVTEPEYKMVNDKAFWQRCIANNMTHMQSTTPTVAYLSKWAAHYQNASRPIPNEAVWMEQDTSGNYVTVKHKDRSIK
jgi:glycosyltransferase involved in cell wall biosynthesis